MQPIPKLILPQDYVKNATAQIRKAKTRVALLTMVLVHDSATDELLDALCEAAERGVEVTVAADSFTYTDFQGSYIPTTYRSKRVRDAMKVAPKQSPMPGAETPAAGKTEPAKTGAKS